MVTIDNWEALCDRGRAAALDMDEGRWQLGDLSLEIQTQYGKNRIADFAKEVNVPVGRVREYRTVCRYYESSARAEILEDCPLLSYSHLRIAMRFGNIQQSIGFLNECADGAFTVERTIVELNKLLKKPIPPPKLLDAECELGRVDIQTGMIVIKVGKGANLIELQKWRGKEVRVVIYALEVEAINET